MPVAGRADAAALHRTRSSLMQVCAEHSAGVVAFADVIV